MAIPLVLHVASVVQLAPIAAAFAVRGRHQPVPYPRVVTWCLFSVGSNVVDLVVARRYGGNLWTSYFTLPVEVGLVLWLLAAWQPNAFLRLAYHLAIPLMGVAAASVLILTDPAVTFYRWVAPFLALLALAAALHTLVHRTLKSRAPLTEQDWFWFCLGLSLYWMTYVSLPVFADAFVATHVDWVRTAYIGRAWTYIVALLLMTWGVRCHRLPARSPGPS